MGRYKDVKRATAEVVGIRVLRKSSTEKAHAAIRDMIVANPDLSYQQIADLLACSRWLVYRVAVEFNVRRPRGAGSPSRRGGAVKRKKYFGEEYAFEFVWQNADHDGIWHGDAASLAAEFGISEEAAEAVLDELRTRRLIEKLYTGKYIIVNWRDRDDADSTCPFDIRRPNQG